MHIQASYSDCTRKMQKYLRLLNIRLDVVVKDVTGLTGLSIVESVCNGETNPQILASLRNGNCKKSEEELAKSLQSNKRPDYLFALKQELHLPTQYEFLDQKRKATVLNRIKKQIDKF